ncbi:Ubiquitin fusion degradation protein 1 homolog, partial [Durusdinium trenchii]
VPSASSGHPGVTIQQKTHVDVRVLMAVKDLVEELFSTPLCGDDLWRLNEAVFNVDNAINSQLAGRPSGGSSPAKPRHLQGHYLAFLGTLQNQPCFSARQSALLRQWIAEALQPGRERDDARNSGERPNWKKLRQLEETSQALSRELQKLKTLQKAVQTFASFEMPGRKTSPSPPKTSPPVPRSEVARKGAEDSKPVERKKAEEPGYQVQTDFGWTRYDATAQEQIRSAASKGRPDCEIFAQGQYYKVDLKRMVQINPSTGNERTVRLAGLPQPAPEMPKLNFKRLLVEFKQVEAAIAAGEAAPWLLRCEPVEDNLMEWEVDMSFPAESDLQKSLENLAASMFDTRLNRLTLCVRFTVEFPLSPPEVWLRRPRMRYREGKTGPVTFGGRVCSLLLASAGWQPATSMLSVFKEVQQSLLESEIEANTMVHVKKEYPKASIQLERLNTELFHTVNGFCREGMTALSPEAAQPFLGDLKRLEVTDKIGLPLSYANSIYQRAELGADLVLPMIFEIKTLLGRKSHCAIFEFFDGLPEMHVLIPKWVMEDLAIDEREPVRVRGVELDLVTSVKVQPHSVDFYHAVRDSGREVRELLTESLARFSTLTEDTAVPIEVNEKFFQVQVLSVEPHGAVRIIDMDVQHHFEFKVEFEPAPDLEDEAATKEYQDRVLNSIKLRRERSAAGRQEMEQKRLEARRKRYQDLLQKVSTEETPAGGADGTVEIALRMPDGSQVKGKYSEGLSVQHLLRAALESKWAQTALPWGLYLRMAFPKKVLKEDDLITKDFHRSALSVQEEQAPEKDEELFAVLWDAPMKRPKRGEPEALAPLPVPERDEATLMARTQRAFEMQRFLRAGFSLEEAEEKFQAGEILPPTAASRRPVPKPPGGPGSPKRPQLKRSLSEEEERMKRVEEVMSFTGVERSAAEKALEETQWITDLAVNHVLDGLVAD